MSRALFVYGTLMRDGARGSLLANARRRPARARGRLYDLPAGYPAMTDGPFDVFGELVEPIPDALLALIDTYEGVAEGLYHREIREVRVDTQRVEAWVYLMDHPRRRGGVPIPTGRWRATRMR